LRRFGGLAARYPRCAQGTFADRCRALVSLTRPHAILNCSRRRLIPRRRTRGPLLNTPATHRERGGATLDACCCRG